MGRLVRCVRARVCVRFFRERHHRHRHRIMSRYGTAKQTIDRFYSMTTRVFSCNHSRGWVGMSVVVLFEEEIVGAGWLAEYLPTYLPTLLSTFTYFYFLALLNIVLASPLL